MGLSVPRGSNKKMKTKKKKKKKLHFRISAKLKRHFSAVVHSQGKTNFLYF